MRKDKIERAVFEEFIDLAGLLVDQSSIDQLAPPAPDVVCTIRGKRRYFELTRFTDEQVEKKVNTGANGWENVRVLRLSDISNVIRSKAEKKYIADDGPIDLVIYEGARWLVLGAWASRQAQESSSERKSKPPICKNLVC